MKKTTLKNSKRIRKTKKKTHENLIILGIFLIFVMVVAYLFYSINIQSVNEYVVATVNTGDITRDQLDWWYKASILPEFRNIITKQDFLVATLIPQELLMQEAKKENIKQTEDEIEQLLGIFIIENGLTLDEFGKNLESSGITIDQIKKSFEARAIINKLLEKKNIELIGQENDRSFQDYLDTLIDGAEIEIFQENIDKFILRSFEETGDNLCYEGKPIIRLYTTSTCGICNRSSQVFENLIKEFVNYGSADVAHWSLDDGDNLLTSRKENGVPKKEVDLFKKYSPNNLVPVVVLGCKYKRIGKFGIEEQDEFKAILKILIDG